MDSDQLYDSIFDALIRQSTQYQITGIVEPLMIDGKTLTVDDDDPPEVRRRVIYFRAKLREWKAATLSQQEKLSRAQFISMANVEAIIEEMI